MKPYAVRSRASPALMRFVYAFDSLNPEVAYFLLDLVDRVAEFWRRCVDANNEMIVKTKA